MLTLIVARHGNTFEANETPRRVGLHTNLPLVEKGHEQARDLGCHLHAKSLIPDVVFTSELKRAQQTADGVCRAMNINRPINTEILFNEIDYGPDENKTEDEVIARIGEQAIEDWNLEAKVPDGWNVKPTQIKNGWRDFAKGVSEIHDPQDVILVVTSNGVARFAPYITGDFESFRQKYPLKLSTGAYGILEFDGSAWSVKDWNVRP